MIHLTYAQLNIMFEYGAVGALSSLMTDILAIEMLFHPYKKILGFQGYLMRDKEFLAQKMQTIFRTSKRDVHKFLTDNRESIPAIGRFFINRIDPLKVSGVVNNYLNEKFTMSDRELESFCKMHFFTGIRFIEITGAIAGFIIGILMFLAIEVLKRGGKCH